MTWRAPTLPASEQVAIAVGNQLRLANARFEIAIRRFGPQTIFQEMIAELDALVPEWEVAPSGAFRRRRHLASGYIEEQRAEVVSLGCCGSEVFRWPGESVVVPHLPDCSYREETP